MAQRRKKLREVLEVLARVHHMREDAWRSRAFARGAEIVEDPRLLPRLENPTEAVGVGPGIAKVVHAVLRVLSSSPHPLDDDDALELACAAGVVTASDARGLHAFTELSGVLGVGEKLASRLVKKDGIFSVEDLRRAAAKGDAFVPNELQRVGLEHHERLRRPLSRDRAIEVADRVIDAIHGRCQLRSLDPRATRPLGSLRRGVAARIGDVDLLVYVKEDRDFEALARRLPRIIGEDYLATIKSGATRYSFVLRHRRGVHQLDVFRARDRVEWASTLLHGTGSAAFNEMMRGKAKRRGYLLNEYGLFPDRGKGGEERLRLTSEEQIFSRLQMPYVRPRDRR